MGQTRSHQSLAASFHIKGEVVKLLIDECLHTSLVELAHAAGHVADHVNYLGLGSSKDWELMATIRAQDYTSDKVRGFDTLYTGKRIGEGIDSEERHSRNGDHVRPGQQPHDRLRVVGARL